MSHSPATPNEWEPTRELDTQGLAPDPAGINTCAPETRDEAAVAATGRRKPLIFLGAGIVVLLVIAGVVWAIIHTSNTNRSDAIKHAASTYLEAIASGDAQGAVSKLADKPANGTLLTGEVLAVSRGLAPLTDIAVTNPVSDGKTATVTASYRLGDQPVSTTLNLTGDGRTQWLITNGTADLKLDNPEGLLINSATVTQATNPVFPGTYTVGAGTDNIALAGTARVVASPGTDATLAVTPSLSESGKQHLHNALKARLDECLASTDSRPANCPFGVATGDVEIAPGSVKFALINNPWAQFAPTLDIAKHTATGQLSYVIDATATVTRGGLTTDSKHRLERTVRYSVDLSKEPMPVVWSAA